MLKVDKLNKESKPSYYIHPDSIPIEALDKMNTDIEREDAEKSFKESKLLEYKADKFDGIVWIWDWIHNDLINQYEAKNITPICPHSTCKNVPMKLGLTGTFGTHYYICPNCCNR